MVCDRFFLKKDDKSYVFLLITLIKFKQRTVVSEFVYLMACTFLAGPMTGREPGFVMC